MTSKKKNIPSSKKVEILREHLENNIPISGLAERCEPVRSIGFVEFISFVIYKSNIFALIPLFLNIYPIPY